MQILRSRWDLHELFSPCFFVHEFSPNFLVQDFCTSPRTPLSKINGLSLKVCRLCCDWSQNNSLTAILSRPNNTSHNLHKEIKCSNRDLSVGPNHQQNIKIAVSAKFCKDVAVSQPYSAKGRRQLVYQVRMVCCQFQLEQE